MKGNSSRLRKGRFSEIGRIYLVTFVTYKRRAIFTEFDNARLMVSVLKRESEYTKTLCFVVMPDHVHWLLQLGDTSLSKTVQRVKSISSRAIKRKLAHNCSEAIWQNGFHDHALRKDEDLVKLARYVVMNPVRAGLASKVGKYSHWDAVWVNGE
ncbi:REP-associated tyrosine transposase [Neptuniibacter sp. SY11_33]|uniref:REP-associated tyrosine transposase n=1 Tax=Neptuniibacter sp. SY11_33 TaxID=3398215 RepID=UPI0039F56D35